MTVSPAGADRPDLSLVVPAYNEAANLPGLVARAAEAFGAGRIELVLVDNGSTDGTPDVVRELAGSYPFLRPVRVPVNRGYGHGIVSGLRESSGEFLGWTHADHQTDPGDGVRALELVRASRDPETTYVKGRRYGRPFTDTVFTAGMSLFCSAALGARLVDVNAQPSVFHRSFFDTWTSPPDDFSLDLYALRLARARGWDVLRFPVRFGERAHGVSHWNVDWKSKVKFIKRTAAYTLRLRRAVREGR